MKPLSIKKGEIGYYLALLKKKISELHLVHILVVQNIEFQYMLCAFQYRDSQIVQVN